MVQVIEGPLHKHPLILIVLQELVPQRMLTHKHMYII